MNWKDFEYVVFDFETTGLEAAQGDEIIEIGALRFKGDLQDPKTYQTFVKPKKELSKQISEFVGITQDDLKDAPAIDKVFNPFINFCKGAIPIAQNAKFDLSFLEPLLQKNECMSFFEFCVDTKLIAKKIWFYERGHNLDVIAARLGIPNDTSQRHRSIYDCEITAKCFLMMIEKVGISVDYLTELKKYAVMVKQPVIELQGMLPMFE